MISLTERGLYCEAGGFHIDPTRRVEVALITHAHSDHARRGSKKYYCAEPSVKLLQHRLGPDAHIVGVPYRKKVNFGETYVSFHPAGHILGSAQIRIEVGSKVWVVSGDYKREPDPTCEPFEAVKCDTFISEATFGHPKYEWGDQANVAREIHEWWQENRCADRNSVLFAYALGKAQRVLAGLLEHTKAPVYVFGETAHLTRCYRSQGVKMVPTISLEELKGSVKLRGELIVAPHAIAHSPWMRKLSNPATAFASGWMRTGAFGMGGRYERGFVMSDHADYPALVKTIQESGAKRVFILHGGEGPLTRHLRKLGINASAMEKDSEKQMRLNLSPQGELFTS